MSARACVYIVVVVVVVMSDGRVGWLVLLGLRGARPAFYDAYHEVLPRREGHVERMEVYRLYHLLNQLNLYGAGLGEGGTRKCWGVCVLRGRGAYLRVTLVFGCVCVCVRVRVRVYMCDACCSGRAEGVL